MMKLQLVVCALAVAACGGNDEGTITIDPGDGTHTLLVVASADHEEGNGSVQVRVDRAGQDADDAVVVVSTDLGEQTLPLTGGGEYRATLAGWPAYFALSVTAGEDELHGSIEAPEMPLVFDPDPTMTVDLAAIDGPALKVRWSGELAQTARVRSNDFEQETVDTAAMDIPKTFIQEGQQEIRVRRHNSTALAGGIGGSQLSASIESRADMNLTGF